jgi:hypothetical protein
MNCLNICQVLRDFLGSIHPVVIVSNNENEERKKLLISDYRLFPRMMICKIICRIGQTKVAFKKMRNIFCNENLSMEIRRQGLKAYVKT